MTMSCYGNVLEGVWELYRLLKGRESKGGKYGGNMG